MDDKPIHDYRGSKGGFWIKADGTSIPIKAEGVSSHYDVARLNFPNGEKHGYVPSALDAGWVRISTYDAYECTVEWHSAATLEALKSAVEIVRHFKKLGRPYSRSMVEINRGEDAGYESIHWSGEQHLDKCAREIMRRVLELSKAQKLAALAVQYGSGEPKLSLAA